MNGFLFFVVLSVVASIFSSCNSDVLDSCNESFDESFTLCEKCNETWDPYVYHSKLKTRSNDITLITNSEYLGFSWKLDTYPIEDSMNLGYRVVNTAAFIKQYPSYFNRARNNAIESSYFSFTNFDEYISKSSYSKKIHGGLDIHFLGISICNKHNHTSTFSQSFLSDEKSVFGELNINIRDSIYRMQYSSLINTKLRNYLDPVFVEELHNTHPYEFYLNYGPFVLREFAVGGKAIALYAGIHKSNSNESIRTSDMNSEIESSFNIFKDKDLSNSSLIFGRGHTSSDSYVSNFTSSKLAVKTLGGNAIVSSFSIPQDISSVSIDLTSWLNTLDNYGVNDLCEFGNGGLIPITDFILENNIKRSINEYIKGYNPINTSIREPVIVIDTIHWNLPILAVRISLFTRYGYPIILDTQVITENWEKSLLKLGEKVRTTFGVNVYYSSPVYDNISELKGHLETHFGYPNFMNFYSNFDKTTKIIHDGIVYIIVEEYKIGLSIPNILKYQNEYKLADKINNIPFSNLNYNDLWDQDYMIYSL